MPANEFEKQVQQQLDDFQLNPSASVWKKVEEQIRSKKRRRVIFFVLLPVLLGLLSYSVYYFLNTGKKTELAQQPVVKKNEQSLTNTKSNTSEEPKDQPVTPKSEEAATSDQLNTTTSQKKKPVTVSRSELQILSNNPSIAYKKNKPVTKDNDEITTEPKKSKLSPVINNNAHTKENVSVTVDQPETGIVAKKEIIKNPVQETNDQKLEIIVGSQDPVAIKTDSAKKDDGVKEENKNETIGKKKSGKPKIKWGIDLSAGMASNNNGAFSFEKAVAFDNYSSAGTTAGNPPSAVIPPSAVRSGPAFRMGVVAEWRLSKRSVFSAGFQYAYSSNRIKVGAATDTTVRVQSNANSISLVADVDKLYRGASKNNFTNRYHFISIPLGYHLQLNKGKKVSVQWDADIAIGYLFATNALVYSNTLGGVYYHDKKAFNKVHFNPGTGLSFRFKTKSGTEWTAGPALSFDMSRLIRNDDKQYLLFGGINVKLFLPKKKK